MLVDMVGTRFDGRHDPTAARMSGGVGSSRQAWQVALDEHEAICRALEGRNPQAAATALCSHLAASHGRWAGEPDGLVGSGGADI
jgi:DNA-binding GntR family transcriptional regulator